MLIWFDKPDPKLIVETILTCGLFIWVSLVHLSRHFSEAYPFGNLALVYLGTDRELSIYDPTLEGPPSKALTLNPLAVQHLDNQLYISSDFKFIKCRRKITLVQLSANC